MQNSPINYAIHKSPLSPITSPQPGSVRKNNRQAKVPQQWADMAPIVMDNNAGNRRSRKQLPSMPSMNAPMQNPNLSMFASKKSVKSGNGNVNSAKSSITSTLSSKSSKKKRHRQRHRHYHNRSDSSIFGDNDIGNKYEYMGINTHNHKPRQSSILSSVFGDDDIDSDDSIVISSDDEGNSDSSATNTVGNNDDQDREQFERELVKSRRILKRQHLTNTNTNTTTNTDASISDHGAYITHYQQYHIQPILHWVQILIQKHLVQLPSVLHYLQN